MPLLSVTSLGEVYDQLARFFEESRVCSSTLLLPGGYGFEDILKSQYPLSADMPSVAEDITYEDANVVRYVAGYVYCEVNAKIAVLTNFTLKTFNA